MSSRNEVPLAGLIAPTGRVARRQADLPVYSVTKHRGFVPSLEYFKKQVFSRELSNYTIVEPGEFAYATIHLDEGSIGICPERCLISPMYTAFRLTKAGVRPGFLLRYLKCPRALAVYGQLGKGSADRRRSISLERLGELTVPCPSSEDQDRIASILDTADDLRAKRRATLALLDSLTSAVFLEMFGDPVANQQKWPNKRLVDLLEVPLRNGLSPSTSGGVQAKVLSLAAITGERFDSSAWKTAPFQSPPPIDKSVNESDFLVCRGNGNKRLVGRGQFPSRSMTDTTFPDTMIAARCRAALIEPEFLLHLWNSDAVRRQIETRARTTNGTFKINQEALEGVSLILPPREDQRRFGSRSRAIHRVRSAHLLSAGKLDSLFASLQHKAFNGELNLG